MDDPRQAIRWLALGIALGSREALGRLLTTTPAELWDGPTRRLGLALGAGREEVVRALAALGVAVGDGRRAADAVLDEAAELGRRERQKAMAAKLEAAARVMPSGRFAEYARELLGGENSASRPCSCGVEQERGHVDEREATVG